MCSVFRADRVKTTERNTAEYGEIQRSTAEYASLECWLGDKTPYFLILAPFSGTDEPPPQKRHRPA